MAVITVFVYWFIPLGSCTLWHGYLLPGFSLLNENRVLRRIFGPKRKEVTGVKKTT